MTFARRVLLPLFHYAGVLWLWRVWHRRAVTILTVHGVMDASGAAPGSWRPLRRRHSRARLDECLGWIGRSYRFVTLDDAVEMLSGRRPVTPYAMVLTFDDGYRNQITEALPVLRAHGVPSTIFVSTGHSETRRPFWFDRLDHALQHAAIDERRVSIGGEPMIVRGTTRDDLDASYEELRARAKAVPRDDREMVDELEGLSAHLEAESGHRLSDGLEADDWCAVLTPDEIRRSRNDVCFGSHTVDHLRVNRLDLGVVDEQLRGSKQALEAWTGQPCRFFCYPDGGSSAASAERVRACGYVAAVTGDGGVNRVGADLMTLRRLNLPYSGSRLSTLAAVSGFSHQASHLRARLRAAWERVRGGARRRDATG